jgi:hypothetical protein
MAGIRIEINTAQLDDLIERIKTADRRVQAAAQATIAAEADALTERIRARWPVDTGYSKPLWKAIRLSVWRWIVTNQAFYAQWVFAKGDRSHTPLLYTWIAGEIARSRATLLLALRSAVVEAIRSKRSTVVRGGRLPLGAR